MSSGSNGFRLRSHLAAGWTSGFFQGTIRLSANAHPPPSPKCTTSSRNRGVPPARSCIRPSASVALTSVNGAESKGYKQLLIWISLWLHISVRPQLFRWEARACHPSKPCRATSALLDMPTWRLNKRLQRFTRWLCSRSSRPRCSPTREAGLDSASADATLPEAQLPRPRSSSLYCISRRPLSAGCRGKGVHGSSRAHYSARVSDRCNSGQNKTRIFSKREQKSAYHKHPTLMQPVCTAVSTPSPGVSTRVMFPVRRGYTLQICSKTTSFPRCACHNSAQ